MAAGIDLGALARFAPRAFQRALDDRGRVAFRQHDDTIPIGHDEISGLDDAIAHLGDAPKFGHDGAHGRFGPPPGAPPTATPSP